MKPLAHAHDLDHLRGALEWVPEDRRKTAVDGGAHRGAWTEVMANEFKRVIAFEPNTTYAESIPGLENVEVHTSALGSRFGSADLVDGEENEGQCHLMPGSDVMIAPLDIFKLDDLDFLKLDVEGFEQPALEGAHQTIEVCRPWVMIEENDLAETYYGHDADGARKRLRQWGYRKVGSWNKDHLYAP